MYIYIYIYIYTYMLCAKYGFAQSMDCPAQSSDLYFAQQSTDLLRIPWIVLRQVAIDTLRNKHMDLLYTHSMDLPLSS